MATTDWKADAETTANWNGGDTSATAAEEVTFGNGDVPLTNGGEDTGVDGGDERVCRQ